MEFKKTMPVTKGSFQDDFPKVPIRDYPPWN